MSLLALYGDRSIFSTSVISAGYVIARHNGAPLSHRLTLSYNNVTLLWWNWISLSLSRQQQTLGHHPQSSRRSQCYPSIHQEVIVGCRLSTAWLLVSIDESRYKQIWRCRWHGLDFELFLFWVYIKSYMSTDRWTNAMFIKQRPRHVRKCVTMVSGCEEEVSIK